MADRTDFYFRQKVTEAELDLAFTLLEKADRDLAADIGIYGIVSGAEPTPHTPVPDLTIDLRLEGVYDIYVHVRAVDGGGSATPGPPEVIWRAGKPPENCY